MELLKDYDMNVHYDPGKANVVADTLSRMRMGITTDDEDGKKELVKDVFRLDKLGVQLMASTSGRVSIHPSSESSLVGEVKKGMYINPLMMDLKDSVLIKLNESFALRGDGIYTYIHV